MDSKLKCVFDVTPASESPAHPVPVMALSMCVGCMWVYRCMDFCGCMVSGVCGLFVHLEYVNCLQERGGGGGGGGTFYHPLNGLQQSYNS